MKFFMLCRPEQIPGFHASLCNTTQFSNLHCEELIPSSLACSLHIKLGESSEYILKTIYHILINLLVNRTMLHKGGKD